MSNIVKASCCSCT